MKPLILYYSRSGNTEKIALQAQEALKCESIKSFPKKHTEIILPPAFG